MMTETMNIHQPKKNTTRTNYPIREPYPSKSTRGIALVHWPWSSILTQCRLLTDGGEIEDSNHHWIIEHLVRFLSHPSTGVIRFHRMPGSWKEACELIAAGARVKKSSDVARQVAGGWIQETRDLGLQLTEFLRQPVPVKLSRTERSDPIVFMGRVLDGLCDDHSLEIEYVIPDGVSDLQVRADLRRKSLTSSMTIGAAEDRKTAKARVNWLLRQLAKTPEDGVHVTAVYGRRQDIQAALDKVREDPSILCMEDPKVCPKRFEVKLITVLGRRMDGPKTIVQALEEHVPEFYSRVGQYLRPWVPSAPKVATAKGSEEKKDDGGTDAVHQVPVESGTESPRADQRLDHPTGAEVDSHMRPK